MPAQEIVNYLEEHHERDVAAIQELVRQPSVSTEKLGGVAYAALLRDHYASIGCAEAEVVDVGDGVPGVWAYLDGGASRTLGCYSYFDTYGVDEARVGASALRRHARGVRWLPRRRDRPRATVKGSHRALDGGAAGDARHHGVAARQRPLHERGRGDARAARTSTRSATRRRRTSARSRRSLDPRIAERPGSNEIPVMLGYKNMVTFDLVCRASHWGRGPVAGTVYGNSKSVVDAPTHRSSRRSPR